MLDALIISRTRTKILSLFLSHPDERFHLREIVRKTSENYNSIRRELNKLESIGVLLCERKANLKYYFINKRLPIYTDLKNIYYKTDGLGDIIKEDINHIGQIEKAFIYGSIAKNSESLTSDVDLFIIGKIDENGLIGCIRKIEEKISREINYVWFTPDEFKNRVKTKDPFVTNVLKEEKIMLVGEKIGAI